MRVEVELGDEIIFGMRNSSFELGTTKGYL